MDQSENSTASSESDTGCAQNCLNVTNKVVTKLLEKVPHGKPGTKSVLPKKRKLPQTATPAPSAVAPEVGLLASSELPSLLQDAKAESRSEKNADKSASASGRTITTFGTPFCSTCLNVECECESVALAEIRENTKKVKAELQKYSDEYMIVMQSLANQAINKLLANCDAAVDTRMKEVVEKRANKLAQEKLRNSSIFENPTLH